MPLQILRRLQRRHTVHFVAYLNPNEDADSAPEYCSKAWPVTPPRSPHNLRPYALQVLREALSPMPVDVRHATTLALSSEINRLVEQERFDIVVCDALHVARNIPDMGKCVLFESNVESMILRRHRENASRTLLRLHWGIQERRTFALERRICRAAAGVIAISTTDADALKDLYGVERVSAIAVGVDSDYFAPPPPPSRKADLVFVGCQSWWPNVDGAIWFVREILPLIRAKRPDCTVSIVGSSPLPEVVALGADDPLVEVTGTVPDVRPWLWGSQVCIVPLRVGGGVRIKIYEAMAAGIPVVATPVGAEGLDVKPFENIRLAGSAEEFADACLELLADPMERRRMAHEARQMVQSECTWDRTAERFESILAELLGGRPQRGE
ncbi:MAG: glycosyltransferase [Bryobacteraceae bacterium]